jgi:hypothetical protein
MAKSKIDEVTELETLATKLESLAAEATAIGEDRVAKSIGNAVRSARAADKQKAVRFKRVGSLVTQLKAKGLSDKEIVAQLTR